jgi:hypothetical protein
LKVGADLEQLQYTFPDIYLMDLIDLNDMEKSALARIMGISVENLQQQIDKL